MIAVSKQKIAGVLQIKPTVHEDERGFFAETYREELYGREGILPTFVQDNHSFSKKGTLRGMHFQSSPGQAKLVTVIVGTIYDVFVDLRPESPTFLQWEGVMLDAGSHEQLYIPIGFAHGFAAMTDAHVHYKVSAPFDPETERTFSYADAQVGIEWPVDNPILSEKDRLAPSIREVLS
ncbi:MAG: dTDP-4-dehydrorhamnose 3,5-epimerase [Chlamydiae bacterium]|nr:dTDP-4-dehydrorhamnose 3,5-epimerase [Chlamydiota bacterium]